MNAKVVAIVAICIAVVAGGVSGVIISMQRSAAERAAAERAASEETIATKRAREAETERATAAAKAREEEAKAQREKTALAAAEEANEKLRLENENLAEKKAIAAEERAKAAAEAQKAADVKAAKELDERERALRPEKTIADVSWLPDDDIDIDENGRPRPKKKKPYLAENDPNLSAETRELAKASRIRAQADDILAKDSRKRVVAPVEKLYVAAVKEGRTVDAAYYRAALKSMYPDWEYKPPSTSAEGAQAPNTNQP